MPQVVKHVLKNVLKYTFYLELSPGVAELLRRYFVVLNAQLLERNSPSTTHNKIATGIVTKYLLEHAGWITTEYNRVCKEICVDGCNELIRASNGDASRFASAVARSTGKTRRSKLVQIYNRGRSILLSGEPTSDIRRLGKNARKVRARSGYSSPGTDLGVQEAKPSKSTGPRPAQQVGDRPEPELLKLTRELIASRTTDDK